MALSGCTACNVAIGKEAVVHQWCSTLRRRKGSTERCNHCRWSTMIAVKRFFQNQATTGLNAMANHTLMTNLTAPFGRRGSLKSRNVEVRRIGRDAIRSTWKPVTRSTRIAGDADGTHVVRKYTTAGTGKGFVDEGVRSMRL